LRKKPKATKCSDHHTVFIVGHTSKIVTRVLRRRIERIEDVRGEDQFGYRRRKGSKSDIGILRVISERTL
jgi:hypothetical protein